MAAGCDEVGLADTSGYADPAAVKRVVTLVRGAVGADAVTGIHLHNTRGLGLANVLAGLEAGLTTFDSSLGGLGGCPFAPGASGNIVTEALVFMLEAMGLSTTVADLRFAKPLDEELIRRLLTTHEVAVTVEEAAVGGFGAHVLTLASDEGLIDAGLKLRTMRLPDMFQDQDNPMKQYDTAGLNAPHIVETVLKALRRNSVGVEVAEGVSA